VNELLRERRRLSPEMAARLGRFLDMPAESLLAMQSALDLWQVYQYPERLAFIEPRLNE
jgi:addiction module HigA family antidote